MSDEQKEEMRRKQREYSRQYRQRKNAESHNSALCLDKENTDPTTDGNHSYGRLVTGTTIESGLPFDNGNYQLPNFMCHLIPMMTDLTGMDMQVLLTQ